MDFNVLLRELVGKVFRFPSTLRRLRPDFVEVSINRSNDWFLAFYNVET